MESNRGQKRSNTSLDHNPNKFHKADHHVPDNDDLDGYEPPRRAQRTGCIRKEAPEATIAQTLLSDLVLPRSTYDHQSMQEGRIRLLYLLPGSGDDPITCDLKIFDREGQIPRYEALSYCWGSDSAVHEILVEGQTFYTGQNLHNALRHLRQPNSTTILWIDALCIDQRNDEEKSHQIRQMDGIYQSADNVLIWLGEDDADSEIAIRFISRLLDPKFLSEDDWHSTYAWGFYALSRLLERPYFSRLWTVQEVALAENPILKCGDHEVHFMDLVDSCEIIKSRLGSIKRSLQSSPLYHSQGHLLQNFEDSNATRFFDAIRNIFIRSNNGQVIGRSLGLESLVCDLAPFQATNPRDSIFALLGLVKDTDILPAGFQPDYSKSVLDVYAQFTAACVRTSGSLDIICRPWAPVKKTAWNGDLVDPDLLFQVPSWIPVRSDSPFGNPKYKIRKRLHADRLVGSAKKEVYNAHNGVRAQVRFGIDDMASTYDGSLFAKGFFICTIDELSTRIPDGVILKECLEMIGRISRDEHGNINGMDDSVWRTLCANRNKSGDPPPCLYRMAALHLLQISNKRRSVDTAEILDTGAPEYQQEFLERVQAVTWNRRVFRGGEHNAKEDRARDMHFLGLAPRDAKGGDSVCILFGVSVPVVLRQHQMNGRSCWQLIGEAYVDGSMDGEELCSLTNDDLASRTIEFELR